MNTITNGGVCQMAYREEMQKVQQGLQQSIVHTACHLFMERGIEPVKMTDLALSADVGVASLYRYFGTKREVVIQAGIHLWHKVAQLLDGVFTSEVYLSKTGLAQCEDLLKVFLAAYTGHAPYVKFLRDFDLFMEREQVPQAELAAYEASILDLQTPARAAYRKGLADGTLRGDFDFETYYFTVTHALLLLSQKLVCAGALVESDARVSGEKQLLAMIDMAVTYIKK